MWTPEFSVGIKAMDGQHQRLLGYISDLQVAITQANLAAFHDLLHQLTAYAHEHFEAEEKLLKAHGYPMGNHIEGHFGFISFIAECNLRMLEGNLSGKELLHFLESWWKNHILGEDMAYKTFLNARGVF